MPESIGVGVASISSGIVMRWTGRFYILIVSIPVHFSLSARADLDIHAGYSNGVTVSVILPCWCRLQWDAHCDAGRVDCGSESRLSGCYPMCFIRLSKALAVPSVVL